MSQPVLTAQEMIAWNEKTSNGWRVKTVAELLQHIVAVELRFAQRLSDVPVSDYANIPIDSVESIYATHVQAITIFKQLLASDIDWDASIEFITRSMGPARSARKTILFHALLHSIRHYAQLATLARQLGVKSDLPMDYLLMDIEIA
jgi:uncharacterized damage-inducible protein DinB